MNDFYADKKVDEAITNANIWVAEGGDKNRGSAIMLKEYTSQIASKGIALPLLQEKWWGILAVELAIFPTVYLSHLYPDLTFSYRDDANTKTVDELAFHEGGHYMHAKQAGGSFWADVVNAEFTNILNLDSDPYGDGNQPNISDGELIALAEGWADFTKFRMLAELYDDTTANIEGFVMYNTPLTQAVLQGDNLNDVTDNDSWWFTGLFWDLYDLNDPTDVITLRSCCTPNQLLRDNDEIDEVQGGFLEIFSLLNSSVKRSSDLENTIITSYGSDFPDIIIPTQRLFYNYGF